MKEIELFILEDGKVTGKLRLPLTENFVKKVINKLLKNELKLLDSKMESKNGK